ncbi:hypothetical protein ACFCX0_27735 [Streptomyces sp. NPDC056352]|uniref:hypothetical protein n=1 Tax=Streptomyces sp. NPDC056352 TaxID=3345791 RepID=UPI0035D84E2E
MHTLQVVRAGHAVRVAPRDATGVRFTELPLTRDRVWPALDAAGAAAAPSEPVG